MFFPTADNQDMQEMKIKYGGGNTINANTYINSLIHFNNVVQEVNKVISNDRKVEIRIIANVEGSFILDLMVKCAESADDIKGLFTAENYGYAKDVVKVVGEVYKVAKHLMGRKPKKVDASEDAIRIENVNGNVQVFDLRGANIYLSNPIIKEAISQNFETLESDTSVTDLQLLDAQDNPIVEIPRANFSDLSNSEFDEDSLEQKSNILTVEATLNFSSMDWEFKKNWDFYYNGHKIKAKVKDTAFSESVIKGERFGFGDSLDVIMEIRQEYDETYETYINRGYTVIKVIKHNINPAQGKLDLNN